MHTLYMYVFVTLSTASPTAPTHPNTSRWATSTHPDPHPASPQPAAPLPPTCPKHRASRHETSRRIPPHGSPRSTPTHASTNVVSADAKLSVTAAWPEFWSRSATANKPPVTATNTTNAATHTTIIHTQDWQRKECHSNH